MPDDILDRLEQEKDKLEKNFERLDELLHPDFPEYSEFQLLPKDEQEDLLNQWEVMEQYLLILRRRIQREELKKKWIC